METKEELCRKLHSIEEKEATEKDIKRREENYKKFLERPSDWIIGKAHAESRFHDNGSHHPKGAQMPLSVKIHGNCGHSYIPTAWITDSTYTYFHNVWSDNDRRRFDKALEKLVQKEVEKISKKLKPTLEILGLQSNNWNIENEYPKERKEEIKKAIWEETKKVLDTFKDKDFKELLTRREYEENGEIRESAYVGLSHSKGILKQYLKENRPKLYPLFQNV